jgi:hypothetical protein
VEIDTNQLGDVNQKELLVEIIFILKIMAYYIVYIVIELQNKLYLEIVITHISSSYKPNYFNK